MYLIYSKSAAVAGSTFTYSVPTDEGIEHILCTNISANAGWKTEYNFDDAEVAWSGIGSRVVSSDLSSDRIRPNKEPLRQIDYGGSDLDPDTLTKAPLS